MSRYVPPAERPPSAFPTFLVVFLAVLAANLVSWLLFENWGGGVPVKVNDNRPVRVSLER